MTLSFKDINDYKKFYQSHYNGLVNFIYSRYLQDWDEARDVVQSTFMKIWKNKDRIDINVTPKSYIYQAAKNTALDHIRKYKSRIKVQLEDDINKLDRVEEVTEEQVNAYEIRVKIQKAMNVLKPKTRKIFELHKFEGLTYDEIAEHLQISKRTAQSNVARAMKLLKEELSEMLKFEE